MKNLFRDAVAVTGLACLGSGLYVRFDAGVALIVIGVLLLIPACLAARSR